MHTLCFMLGSSLSGQTGSDRSSLPIGKLPVAAARYRQRHQKRLQEDVQTYSRTSIVGGFWRLAAQTATTKPWTHDQCFPPWSCVTSKSNSKREICTTILTAARCYCGDEARQQSPHSLASLLWLPQCSGTGPRSSA